MERIYIISSIYYKGEKNPQFYPFVAGAQKATEDEWNNLRSKFSEVTDIESSDVKMGMYFDKVFKAKTEQGYDVYYGFHSIWKSSEY